MDNFSKSLKIYPWVFNPFLDVLQCQKCGKDFKKEQTILKVKIKEYVPVSERERVGYGKVEANRCFCQECGRNLTVREMDNWVNF